MLKSSFNDAIIQLKLLKENEAMKQSNTSERLKYLMQIRGLKQVDILNLCQPICKKFGIRLERNDLSQYVSGKNAPGQDKLFVLSNALNVSEAWLMGYDVPLTRTYDNNVSSMLSPSGTVPVYGSIPAGFPALAEQYIEDYLLTTVPNPEDYFALRVKGTSMINAGITDGCKVLCHKQNTADNGQIVVCRLNGDEATLKRFKQQDDMIILIPENPEFEPRIIPVSKFDSGEAEILGVVKQIIIDL